MIMRVFTSFQLHGETHARGLRIHASSGLLQSQDVRALSNTSTHSRHRGAIPATAASREGLFSRQAINGSQRVVRPAAKENLVDLTVALFARFRVNRGVAEIFTRDMIT